MVGSLVIMGGGATISGFVGLAFYEGGVGVPDADWVRTLVKLYDNV